jgi:hypothetical protein
VSEHNPNAWQNGYCNATYDGIDFELENITKTIIVEITIPELKQSDIAKTYALAIKSDEKIDWSAINQAIVARWSRGGLNRVKQMAWRIVGQRAWNTRAGVDSA